jgi:uncharacterized MAPEG superfamily protein
MTTPFWCLLIAVFIPFVLAMTGGYFKSQQFDAVDNNNPRAQSAQLEGAGARAVAAQQNAWEALAMFTPAVAVAHMAGADPSSSTTAALLFVAARVLHAGFYIADLAPLRSVSFLVASGSCIWLFVLAARA